MEQAESSPLRIYVPEGRLCQAAFYLALDSLPAPILNHSVRTFCFAKWLAAKEQSPYANEGLDSLFVACLFHDFGSTETHNHAERFEVCGADAAVRFLKEYLRAEAEYKADTNEPASRNRPSLDASHVWDVWVAIALHTSPGIAERIHPLARLVRLAVLIDFRKATREKFRAIDYGAQVESDAPRLDIEKIL